MSFANYSCSVQLYDLPILYGAKFKPGHLAQCQPVFLPAIKQQENIRRILKYRQFFVPIIVKIYMPYY